MDKSTLSNYGWVVCVILVLAIMISLATPFGSVIRSGVEKTVSGFKSDAEGVLDNMGGATSFDDLGGSGGAGGSGGEAGGEEPVALAPGLYQAGTSTLTKSWADLVAEGIVNVQDGVLTTNYDETDDTNKSAYLLVGDLVIADGVTSIGPRAFYWCGLLKNVTIPNGVTSIGFAAFEYSEITSVDIPASVTHIAQYAFSCASLPNINFGGTKAQWASITFDDLWDVGAEPYVIHCTDGDLQHKCQDYYSRCRCDICDVEMHSGFEDDYRCDLCDSVLPHNCIDYNDGCGWCEVCYEEIAHNCEDFNNGNYWCKICDTPLPHNCEDFNDGNYWCEICGDPLPHECVDSDDDGYCDLCGLW